jgi:hypothetical protein
MKASRGMGAVRPSKRPQSGKSAVLLKKGGEVWDKPNPVKKHTKLTPAKKSAAKAMAKAAGRPYPNMVDNIRAARKK